MYQNSLHCYNFPGIGPKQLCAFSHLEIKMFPRSRYISTPYWMISWNICFEFGTHNSKMLSYYSWIWIEMARCQVGFLENKIPRIHFLNILEIKCIKNGNSRMVIFSRKWIFFTSLSTLTSLPKRNPKTPKEPKETKKPLEAQGTLRNKRILKETSECQEILRNTEDPRNRKKPK